MKEKVMFKTVTLLSCLITVITFIVSVCNYLVAYEIERGEIKEVIFNNPYVKYWVDLTSFFLVVTVFLLILLLIISLKGKKSGQVFVPNTINYRNTYDGTYSSGIGQIDEYVTVRLKKSELSKLRQ
jgi:heme/copper-type cytochrome/quinol oxidase subunit 2